MTTHDEGSSRRQFLRRTGIGIAGIAAAGGAVGAGYAISANTPRTVHPAEFTPLPERPEPGFDHVVVLMFENRSFDNILGRLYTADEKTAAEFDGIAQGDFANHAPDGTRVEAHVYTGPTDRIMQQPQPDPGETYPHVNTQLFDIVHPPANAPTPNTPATNSGFVRDYVATYRASLHREPTEAEYRVAMGGFSPEMLPVFSTLARQFAVYDRWFGAVPSQTYCNRSFFHASTSHGFVVNYTDGSYEKWLKAPASATIFTRLEEAGIPWRVYYDPTQLISLTGLIHAPALEKYWKTNFRDMTQFYADAAAGDLPAYSFIEPRMVFNHNDMHPPVGTLREGEFDGHPIYNSALSDVRAGEALLHTVYSSLRGARSEKGSNALNTALLITFDEHGGTFDHVPPPTAVPPTRDAPKGEMGFAFDRLGCRVPAILVSAYTASGSIIHDEMHHGSLISTLSRLHGLEPLTRRDATANNVFNAINLTTPRQPYEWPTTHPQYLPPNPESTPKPHEEHKHRPLSAPAQGLLGLLLARYEPTADLPKTYGEAYDALIKHGQGLFGDRD